ncbi:MAG: hypothetical protein IPJ08_14235 [Burkholderiales bacterium]|nr:hypothetical protein [Burkholderiales bacterium]
MPKPLRVVLDSNVFSPDHFPTLKQSRFLELVKSRAIVPVFPAVMMEETLRAFHGQSRTMLLTEWLPFILETRVQFCVELPEIWRRELILRKGMDASEYLSATHQRNLVHVLRTLPVDGSSSLMEKVLPGWLRGDEQRKLTRKATIALRRHPLPANSRPLEETLPQLQLAAANRLISFITPHKNVARNLLARWQVNRLKYPFFTQAVDDHVFQPLLPLVDHRAAVDYNARPDLDILVHLVRADVLVTNETRFMARAFDEIWKPRGRLRFSTPEFVATLGCR